MINGTTIAPKKFIKEGYMLQTLDAPLTTISELKKSPRKIIDEATELETGVYILNQSKPEAVIMPVEEYISTNN